MLGVVTATVNRERAEPCLASWRQHASGDYPLVVVDNGGEQPYLGPVAAFRIGVDQMLSKHSDIDIIACFHDDLVILEDDWDTEVRGCFAEHIDVGLASFAGHLSLGDDDLYTRAGGYHPDHLGRCGYVGNLVGETTVRTAQPIVVPRSFSLIARRMFWAGFWEAEARTRATRRKTFPRPWAFIDDLGIVDHFYDGALGCWARRGGWQVWYLPVRCRHLGGQTTDDPEYQRWAEQEIEGGDRGFWEAAHRIGYETFKDELPLRL
jgi:hypothetical protein